jgi:hypothetical protein
LNNLTELENVNSPFQLRGKNEKVEDAAEKVDIAKMVVGDERIARVDSEMDVGDELGVGDGLFVSHAQKQMRKVKWEWKGKVKSIR